MAIKWQIPFASLRTGTIYTVNVYDASYSGSPIVLNGGVAPFTTQEDSDDDPFSPIRIQTGNLCIIDDGFAADGVTPFDWKDFVPPVVSSRPITLTHTVNNMTIVDWQGFIQSQDFSGTLYGNPQERQFPIHCVLEAFKSQQPSTTDIQKHNFAYLLNLLESTAETLTGNVLGFDTFVIQGNADAQQWLCKQFEWMNFLSENNNEEEEITPKYNLFEILEDACKFWGWTCRSQGRTLYLTCYDDLTEPKFVSMTKAQLQTMAGGTNAGTNDVTFIDITLIGDIFASTANDDFKRRGPAKASVKGDCNKMDTLFEFAPPSVRKVMDQGGYSWVAGPDPGTGYFTTTPIDSFDSLLMVGTSSQYGGFCRRQIFSSEEADNAAMEDMFVFKTGHSYGDNIIQIQTKKAMNYVGGTLKISGDVFNGSARWEDDNGDDYITLHVGIGMTRATAKWYYIYFSSLEGTITHQWQSSPYALAVTIDGGSFKKVGTPVRLPFFGTSFAQYDGIPCDENALYGYVFVDFLGLTYEQTEHPARFEIGNFKITFSREKLFIPLNNTKPRQRLLKEYRVTNREYKASNNNGTGEQWNADCIFASDNTMEYGYGLLINPEGTFMEDARYGHDLSDPALHNKMEYPEQHLANRVAAYWAQSKRQITTELRTDAIAAITPLHRITLDGTIFNPTAISRNWRDDVTILTLLESRKS